MKRTFSNIEPSITDKLIQLRNPAKAKTLSKFFKTGPGEYGEGDKFHGVTLPQLRSLISESDFTSNDLLAVQKYLVSEYHEERMVGTLLFVYQYQYLKGNALSNKEAEKLVLNYIAHVECFNNWDFVDVSAHQVLGDFLLSDKTRTEILLALCNDTWPDYLSGKNVKKYEIAHEISEGARKVLGVWPRRVAIVSTFAFIKQGVFEYTLMVADELLSQIEKKIVPANHDLIHKSVGWMLREVWKKNQSIAEEFLSKNIKRMPRVMLRYAVEKMIETKRRRFYNLNKIQ